MLRPICRLFLLLALLWPGADAGATITFVQKAPNAAAPTEVGGASTTNLVFGSNPTAGDAITVYIAIWDSGVSVSSVTDSQSGAYTCVSQDMGGSNTGHAAVCYRTNIGSGGSPITVTPTLSGAAFFSAGAVQWHSDSATLAFDSSVSALCTSSCGSSLSAGTLTPAGGSVYTGLLMSPSGVTSWTVGSGYTSIHTQVSAGTCCAHQSEYVIGTGSKAVDATIGTTGVNWAAVGVALTEGGGASAVRNLMIMGVGP